MLRINGGEFRRTMVARKSYGIPRTIDGPSIKSKTRSNHRVKVAVSAVNAGRQLNEAILHCNRCPRLLAHCATVAQEKRRAYQHDHYWARPVPNFGIMPAKILIVGLAPGAHGANRTGRMFTGDQSGVWLFRALHRAGLATKMHSGSRHDDLRLLHCAITSACHCAPPKNKPSKEEIANCRPWLSETIVLARPKVILAMGQIGWNAAWCYARDQEWIGGKRPAFGHGHSCRLTEQTVLLGSFHPSQQNTFTGRLTEVMLDQIMDQAKSLAGIGANNA